MDSLIFLSGKAVFSTEQQPGSALVALMIRFGPKVVNVSTGTFFSESLGSRWSEGELETVTAEGQTSFFIRSRSGISVCQQSPPQHGF